MFTSSHIMVETLGGGADLDCGDPSMYESHLYDDTAGSQGLWLLLEANTIFKVYPQRHC